MALVEIYTTRFCGYCQSAKALLRRKGIAFTEIDVTGSLDIRTKMFERSKGGYTVPQIFIGGTHVGGSDELYALERAAKLDPLLASEGITTTGPSA